MTKLTRAAQEALTWFDESPIDEIGAAEDAIQRRFPAEALRAALAAAQGDATKSQTHALRFIEPELHALAQILRYARGARVGDVEWNPDLCDGVFEQVEISLAGIRADAAEEDDSAGPVPRVEKRRANVDAVSDRSAWSAYTCAECGGTNVHGTAWIDLNTGDVLPCDAPTDEIWCEDCADHTSLDVARAEKGEKS